MAQAPATGPRWIRVLIFLLSALLFVFYTWLLSFILRDIDRLPGPDYEAIRARYVGQPLIDRGAVIAEEIAKLNTETAHERENQQLVQQSTANSQATLEQLIQLHRASVEKGVNLSAEEQQAFVESEKLFLDNQRKFQAANEEIARLTTRRQELESEAKQVEQKIEEASGPPYEEFQRQNTRHGYRQAALKLAVLLPVLIVAAVISIRKAGSAYRPIVFPLLPASLWLVGLVMHEHFPSELFKYIAISAGILVVIAILVALIRVIVAPRGAWLLGRYREAYNRGQCPICAQPIRRAQNRPLTVATTGGAVEGATARGSGGETADQPYSCPACGTRLFERCGRCEHLRHTLLPYCQSCGAGEGPLVAETQVAP